jgi:hypothetical protein
MLTKADGEMLRNWKHSGEAFDPIDFLKKRARATAEDGAATYGAFYNSLPNAQKKILFDSTHAENKRIATQADADRAALQPDELTEAEMQELQRKELAREAELAAK